MSSPSRVSTVTIWLLSTSERFGATMVRISPPASRAAAGVRLSFAASTPRRTWRSIVNDCLGEGGHYTRCKPVRREANG